MCLLYASPQDCLDAKPGSALPASKALDGAGDAMGAV